jgi:hypothetical protein
LKNKSIALRLVLLSLGASLVSGLLPLFSIISAPLMRAIHNSSSAVALWPMAIASSVLVGVIVSEPLVALAVFSTWATICLYGEFEKRGYAGLAAAFCSIMVGVSLTVAGPFLMTKLFGFDYVGQIKEGLAGQLKILENSGGFEGKVLLSGVTPDQLLKVAPGVAFIWHLMSLSVAMMMGRRFGQMLGLRFERSAGEMRLLDLALPDFLVWITIFSFLFSFMDFGLPKLQTLGMNIFISATGLYFLQGLAILEFFFLAFRVGLLWRLLAYFVLVGQLFFILSVLGFIDFWLNLRWRMKKSRASETQ